MPIVRDHLRDARDYNRGLPAPVRWARLAWALAASAASAFWAWHDAPARRAWAGPVLLLALAAAVFPLDREVAALLRVKLGGDVRRELEAWQQFGAIGSLVFTAAVVWCLMPGRRRVIWDLAVAAAATGLACVVLKMMLGRPRPRFDDPWFFAGPLGLYPRGTGEGMISPLRFWEKGTPDLWSMPSSHTAAAAALAVVLTAIDSRLRGVGVFMVVLVAYARIAGASDLGSHWPSDAFAGAAVGVAVAGWVVRRAVRPGVGGATLGSPALERCPSG